MKCFYRQRKSSSIGAISKKNKSQLTTHLAATSFGLDVTQPTTLIAYGDGDFNSFLWER
ncbi:unnamed protein product [Prunus armeniaca]|uniref:Uncharacterized protein n=1 Tax=Prunus armeniaca TaxID=36596 RepID=A0A6J5XEL8_PRUAR|nr:unnamed protein product [Prunus armeniaca]